MTGEQKIIRAKVGLLEVSASAVHAPGTRPTRW